MKTELFAQGDIILERVADATPAETINIDPDGAVVLARGETTGHRHAFYGGGAIMFRDDALARDVPAELYLGHIRIAARDGAELRHEEHASIKLPPGTYRVRRQREWTAENVRVIAD